MEASGVFEERGNAKSALIDGALLFPTAGGFFDETAVVGGVPKESFFFDVEITEGLTESTDLLIEKSDFLEIASVRFALVERGVGGGFAVRIVG